MAILFGCAWYPEHWPESRWLDDLRLMRAAGMNLVRVAEYAWSQIEPEEAEFNFGWLDRAIELAIQHGMQIVLGTPTSSPPAWMTQRYPDILKTNPDGSKATHGNRAHYAATSSTYRGLGRRVIEAMASRYGQHPAIIGWQIDNEFGAMSYDDESCLAFQRWLQAQYGSLQALNQHWTTAYWSQTYTDWSQIPLPVGNHNPGLRIAFQRFATFVYRAYQSDQIEAIRRYAGPHQRITHNCFGFIAPIDYYAINADLDFASWDHYVGTGDADLVAHSFENSLVRGFKRQNYWIMETQPGSVNWAAINTTHPRGETRAMAWHDIGHGAAAVLYWQWRSALNGQEQYHGCIIAPDGTPRPIYHELASLGRELAALGDVLDDTMPTAQAAILHDYDSRWMLEWQKHHADFDPIRYAHSFYGPLRAALHTVDVIHPKAPLSTYRLVVAPMLHMLDAETVAHLLAFVDAGGHLVLGIRTGVKDRHNALLPSRPPGPLSPAMGAYVEEFYALLEPIPVSGQLGDGQARIWAEWLSVDSRSEARRDNLPEDDDPPAEVLMRYGTANGWLDGQAALVTRSVGRGRITYLGGWFDDALMTQITAWLLDSSGLRALPLSAPLPAGVELCCRSRDGQDYYILINHTSLSHTVTLPFPTLNLLTAEPEDGPIQLAGRDVRLLRRAKPSG